MGSPSEGGSSGGQDEIIPCRNHWNDYIRGDSSPSSCFVQGLTRGRPGLFQSMEFGGNAMGDQHRSISPTVLSGRVKMRARASQSDLQFRQMFEAGQVPPGMFDHRGHLRLTYVYLCAESAEAAQTCMKRAIRNFLERNSVEASKYHETLTASWVLAVRHFMELAGSTDSFDELAASDPRILDQQIMLSHYTKELLFSDRARASFVAPDLEPIPAY